MTRCRAGAKRGRRHAAHRGSVPLDLSTEPRARPGITAARDPAGVDQLQEL